MTESREKYEVIPAEMKALKQWVIWGINEKRPKCPYNPNKPNVKAEADNAATWADFETALSAAARVYSELGRGGIGFELGNGIAGIDLDHAINEAGELSEFARSIVDRMNSYTELSPSGRGLHILFRVSESEETLRERLGGKLGGKKASIELYFGVHYLTVTGNPYGEVKGLAERTEEALQIYSEYLAKTEKKSTNQRAEYSQHRERREDMSISELWERMFNAPNGRYIQALYYGDISGYGSRSEADLALCNHLAFWTGHDARQMDMMFRESGLMRDKWDEQHGSQTYGEMTIAEAIRGTPERNSSYSSYAGYGYSSTGEKEERPNTPNGQELSVEEEQLKPVSEYLEDFVEELLKSREGKAIPTGFDTLNELLDGGLYPGLYFIGAISSLGKTTLALQIADNIAKCGHGVLIFSLEMSRRELMAKTLSRETLRLSLSEAVKMDKDLSTRGILRASFMGNKEHEGLIRTAINEYSSWGKNLTIREGIGDVGVSEIKSYVEAYMKEHSGQAPVVVIDYLQILAPYNDRYTDKQNVDKNVLELKRLSRDYQLPIIGISSFNRENYNAPVGMASFKESGAIEYSSDVLIGMQIDGIDRASDEKEAEYKERVQRAHDNVTVCKREGRPFCVEAKILKHRNGVPGSIHFDFYSRYNLFMERGSTIL